MTIELLPTDTFQYGPNIHFAYAVDQGTLLYLHKDFSWIASDKYENIVTILKSLIHPDSLPSAVSAYQRIIRGDFEGSFTIRFDMPTGKRWLQIFPFLASHQTSHLILGSLVDVTAEILNRESVAKYADKKNSILHMLAHDLRGPLYCEIRNKNYR